MRSGTEEVDTCPVVNAKAAESLSHFFFGEPEKGCHDRHERSRTFTGERSSWQCLSARLLFESFSTFYTPTPHPPVQLRGGVLRAANCSLNTAESPENRRRWRSPRCIIASWWRATASAVPDWESSGPRTQHKGWKRSWFGQQNPNWHLLLLTH